LKSLSVAGVLVFGLTFNGSGGDAAEEEEEEEEEEIIRLPWRGQCGRAAAARALCACCAAGYAKDCTGSPVCF
jgi:hypothetical protein